MTPPTQRPSQSPPPGQPPSIWTMVAFYGVFYLVFMVIVGIGFPFFQEYATPIAALIFPINESNSLLKTLLVMSLMYWGTVGVMILMNKK